MARKPKATPKDKAKPQEKAKPKPRHKNKANPKIPTDNVIILKRFNGEEIYPLKKATIMALKSFFGGITLWFDVEAKAIPLQTCPDTAGQGMRPSASVGIDLDMPTLHAAELVGQELQMAGTKTDDEDSAKALLYYCEHQPLRNNVFKILSRKKDIFHVQWTATTCDVNYYDGSKPLTTVLIEGDFKFKEFSKWQQASNT